MSINQFNVEMDVKPCMVEILNVVATQDLFCQTFVFKIIIKVLLRTIDLFIF